MFQFLRSVALIVATILNCGVAFGQTDYTSANSAMPGCRAYLSKKFPTEELFGDSVRCFSLVEGIAFALSGLCTPSNVTAEQAVRVVMKYIDERPERQHENFKLLAGQALLAGAMRGSW